MLGKAQMGRSNPKVSVVVPVHNAGRTIARAVESLRNQTLEDIEIILADDDSSDRTAQVVEHMAERDIRIEVLHASGQGLPEARDLALGRARGTYVCLMGGGDWAEPSMLGDMVALADAHRLELVITGIRIEPSPGSDGGSPDEVRSCPDRVFTDKNEFRAAAYQLFDRGLLQESRGMLICRERIEGMESRSREEACGDLAFVLGYVRDVERVGVLERAPYHAASGDTASGQWQPDQYERLERDHGQMLELYEHWGLSGDLESMEMVQRAYVERLVGCIESVSAPGSKLPRRQRIALVDAMIRSDSAQLAARVARPRSRATRAMLLPIKAKNARLALAEGRLISAVRGRGPKGFPRLGGSR